MEEINSVELNEVNTTIVEPIVEEEEVIVPSNLTFINFSFETEFGNFTDALAFQEGEFETYTSEQIEAMKQTRLTNWLNYIKSTQVKG